MPQLTFIQTVAISAIPIIFAITLHEAAHGLMASRLGDQTARLSGRLTLNPIKHIDPLGTVVLPLIMLALGGIVFGWAKPVPVDWRNLRNPKRDMAWVAVAGPAANFIMVLVWAMLAKLVLNYEEVFQGFTTPMLYMARAGITINIVLMVLNLLPIPPLDGSRVVSSLLSARLAMKYNKIEPYGLIIILLLFVTGILGRILWPPIAAIYNIVMSLIV
jgi:Zn-dependent protease